MQACVIYASVRVWVCVLWMMPCDRIHAKKQTFQEKNSKFFGLIFRWKKKRRKIVDKFHGCAKCNQLFCVVHGAYGNFGINGWIDKTVSFVHSWKIHSTFVFCCYCVLVNCIIYRMNACAKISNSHKHTKLFGHINFKMPWLLHAIKALPNYTSFVLSFVFHFAQLCVSWTSNYVNNYMYMK